MFINQTCICFELFHCKTGALSTTSSRTDSFPVHLSCGECDKKPATLPCRDDAKISRQVKYRPHLLLTV